MPHWDQAFVLSARQMTPPVMIVGIAALMRLLLSADGKAEDTWGAYDDSRLRPIPEIHQAGTTTASLGTVRTHAVPLSVKPDGGASLTKDMGIGPYARQYMIHP